MTPDLFDGLADVPAASPRDPVTSHEAIAEHTASGRRERHAIIALRLVAAHPGCTGWELWQHATDAEREQLADHQCLYKRLSDLRHLGRVRHGPAKVCRVRGRKMITWELTAAARPGRTTET